MDKKVISLMKHNIENQHIDLNSLITKDCDRAINFIHEQYSLADQQLRTLSRS